MQLTYTAAQRAFRAEVRAWLQANVPKQPLQSFDTEQGFEQHRRWEATLNSGRWSMVTWPPASCADWAASSPESPPPTTTTFLPAARAFSGMM